MRLSGKVIMAAGLLLASVNLQASELIANVKDFVAAYNQKQLQAMMALAAPDIQWMSISGAQIAPETSNKSELETAMKSYFSSMPEARSEIRSAHTSGNFVYALEEAFWQHNGEEKSQCSMAIYEFAADKIKHVWYFASHKC